MAATKTNTASFSGVSLTAGAANQTSSAVDLTGAYAAVANIKLTNGATGPTVAAQVQIETSEDNSKWYAFGGPFVGSTTNSAVASWTVELPPAVMYVRLVAGSNTSQAVTVDADISRITGL